MSYYHWLGREAEDIAPLPDNATDERIEADGFITILFSGPIKDFPKR